MIPTVIINVNGSIRETDAMLFQLNRLGAYRIKYNQAYVKILSAFFRDISIMCKIRKHLANIVFLLVDLTMSLIRFL